MHLLVGNPSAQSGKNAQRIDDARRQMVAHGLTHDFLATTPGGGTIRDVAARLSTGEYEAVVAMGGDGTFREVAIGLIDSGAKVPMGILPTGTANDQGRSFGLSAAPSALERNVGVIAAGHRAPIDGGRVTGFDVLDNPTGTDWFFDSMGFGLSARVLRLRNEDRSIVSGIPILREVYRDQLVYAGAVLQAFLAGYIDEYFFEAEVTTPQGVQFLTGLTDLIVKNTRYYAGMWIFDETSSPEDGQMELVPLRGRNELIARALAHHELAPLLQIPFEPVLKLSPITRAERFRIRILDRPMAAPVETQVDGEEFAQSTTYDVEVVRHALELLVPASGATPDGP